MNPAAGFSLPAVSDSKADSQIWPLAELRWLRAFRGAACDQFTFGAFLLEDGPIFELVACMFELLGSMLPSCRASCRQVAPRCLLSGFKAAKVPSWSHLGGLRGAKNYDFP